MDKEREREKEKKRDLVCCRKSFRAE